MTTVTLDTSGAVEMRPNQPPRMASSAVVWSDLDPFTQGYIEALLQSLGVALTDNGYRVVDVCFRALAPEALARIMEDCRAHQRDAHRSGFTGRQWWAYQAKRGLTPYLGDDGKVYLKDAA